MRVNLTSLKILNSNPLLHQDDSCESCHKMYTRTKGATRVSGCDLDPLVVVKDAFSTCGPFVELANVDIITHLY